jgi:hypothetical protein
MHYDPDFIGCIRVSPPLNEEEVDFMVALADSERTLRSTPTGRGNSDVPFARMAWDVCLQGCCLWWTGDEEEKWIGPTVQFLVEHWFRRGAVGQGHPKLAAFTFDHVLDGVLAIRGRRRSTIVDVSSNVVTWRHIAEPCDASDLGLPPQQPQRPPATQSAAQQANPCRQRDLEGNVLPSNVIELRSRQAGGGGGAAG